MFAWTEATSPHITAAKEGKQARAELYNDSALFLQEA